GGYGARLHRFYRNHRVRHGCILRTVPRARCPVARYFHAASRNLGASAPAARNHAAARRRDRNSDNPRAPLWNAFRADGGVRLDPAGYRAEISGCAVDLGGTAAFGAGSKELVVPSRDSVRDDSPGGAFDRVETSVEERPIRDRAAGPDRRRARTFAPQLPRSASAHRLRGSGHGRG